MGRFAIFLIVVIVLGLVGPVLQLPQYLVPSTFAMFSAVMDEPGIIAAAASTAGPVAGGIVAALVVALVIRATRSARIHDGSDRSGFERLRGFPTIILAPVPILLLGLDPQAELAGASAAALLAGLPNIVRRDAGGIDVALFANWVRDTIAPTVAMVVVIEYLGTPQRGIGSLVMQSLYRLDTALAFGLIALLIAVVLAVEDAAEVAAKQD